MANSHPKQRYCTFFSLRKSLQVGWTPLLFSMIKHIPWVVIQIIVITHIISLIFPKNTIQTQSSYLQIVQSSQSLYHIPNKPFNPNHYPSEELAIIRPNSYDSYVTSHRHCLYPLVNVYITIDNHHFSWENSLFLWSFSIAFCKFTRG